MRLTQTDKFKPDLCDMRHYAVMSLFRYAVDPLCPDYDFSTIEIKIRDKGLL
jgi:hypothetical protein